MTQPVFFKSDCSRFAGTAFIECNSKASKLAGSDHNNQEINELASKQTDSKKKISDLEASRKTLSDRISALQKRNDELTNSIDKLEKSASDYISKTAFKQILDAALEFKYAVTIVEVCKAKIGCDPTGHIQIMQEKSAALNELNKLYLGT